jgi:hypothetical protein
MIHTNIGDICAPYLIGMCDLKSSEKVGIFLVFWVGGCGIDTFLVRIECMYPKYTHKTLDLASTYEISFLFEERTELS